MGRAFGQTRDAVESATVGGLPCIRADWISPEEVRCTLPAANVSTFDTNVVGVQLVGGQSSSAGVLRLYDQP